MLECELFEEKPWKATFVKRLWKLFSFGRKLEFNYTSCRFYRLTLLCKMRPQRYVFFLFFFKGKKLILNYPFNQDKLQKDYI